MSIKPIDLQTLFVKLEEVSKEQSKIKNRAAANQDKGARSLEERGIQQDHSVTETLEDEEIGKIKDEEEETRGRPSRGKEKKEPEDKEKDESGREVLQDPNVGKNIDISG